MALLPSKRTTDQLSRSDGATTTRPGAGTDESVGAQTVARKAQRGAGGPEVGEDVPAGPPGSGLGVADRLVVAERPDQRPGPGQVGPGHGGEEVVLDLGVETADHESGHPAPPQVPDVST